MHKISGILFFIQSTSGDAKFQNDLIEVSDWHEIAIRKQSERFHALRPFSDLMGWLKLVKPGAYQTLIQVGLP